MAPWVGADSTQGRAGTDSTAKARGRAAWMTNKCSSVVQSLGSGLAFKSVTQRSAILVAWSRTALLRAVLEALACWWRLH